MTEFLKLKKSNCKSCYKCIRNCPVKSIRFSGNQAYIIPDECILCGHCFVVCPQDAKVITDDTEKAKVLIASGAPVIASIAPSFIANYPSATIQSMELALKSLGFAAAEETAIGATIVKKRYEEMIDEKTQSIIISSCCHSINLLIEKHFPDALPYLAPVLSPMQAHAADIRRRYPDAKVVFIGPCISKKDEGARYEGFVDCVLTFEDLTKWMSSANVTVERQQDTSEKGRARFFPTTGGILKSMDCTSHDYDYIAVDGVENCINVLKDVINGNLEKCFIEMSACSGSCVNGPIMEKTHNNPVRDHIAVARYARSEDFDVDMPSPKDISKIHPYIGKNMRMPSENEITDILKQMGKTTPADELNCGTCGYNTCREKAIAVYNGKAEISMCLPYLKDKAESFSGNILRNTPNGVLVLNEELEVQEINDAALKIMNIRSASDVLGEQVIRILDPSPFMNVKVTGRNIRNERVYLAEYNKYVDETVIYDKSYRIIMCIMRDITDKEKAKEKRENVSRQAIDITDKVVEKQMRVVQEIASLLGETTAETKIALTKLKESLNDE